MNSQIVVIVLRAANLEPGFRGPRRRWLCCPHSPYNLDITCSGRLASNDDWFPSSLTQNLRRAALAGLVTLLLTTLLRPRVRSFLIPTSFALPRSNTSRRTSVSIDTS